MKRALPAIIISLIAIFLINIPAHAKGKHPFGTDDMLKMYRISDPQLSPNGKWIIFNTSKPDLKKNKNLKDLWLVSIDGKTLKRLTNDANTEYNVRWFPKGNKIAFIKVHNKTAQIWTMNPFTKTQTQISRLPVDVDSLGISPDGRLFSFTADVYPDCGTLACTAKRDKKKSEDPVKVKIYNDLLFRHWDRWEDGKRGHLFIMPTTGGKPTDLTPGSKNDIPTRPWGGPEEITFSPDSKKILYTSKKDPNPERNTNADIFSIDIASGEESCLTCENKGWDSSPAYSPDGQYLAYLSMERPGYESDKLRITLIDQSTGKSINLSKEWDFSPWSFAWAEDGKTIFAPAASEGEQPIFALSIDSGTWKKVIKNHQNGNVSVTADKLVFTQDSFTSPAEIFVSNMDGSDVKRITNLNGKVLDSVEMGVPEKFWFKGAGGDMIQGWFIKPTGYIEGTSYPLAYFVHGGPQWPWNDRFHYRWNMEIAAGKGYATATVNFHGSPGFGQKFTDSIKGDWGGKPYRDIMLGLDHVLKKHRWIDSNRMCALGASYGGYMVNWMEGHTDRFACFVNHDGDFSTYSAYYNTEELWFPEWDMGGTPYENPRNFERWSPDRFVHNWKTPMLVIHGANDYRVVDTEGLSTFTALKRRGVPARLIYFPDENHWVLRPLNSKRWHDEVYKWLAEWTGK
ncbi:MAG: S9 family peptidase [Deltaproteobacteria bacterium]|jgi:dipeptidyl aminopeptidase/acylaminoacyl peptidase|nr:S9 family peptidase [Deltaproteobacteria bacterium]